MHYEIPFSGLDNKLQILYFRKDLKKDYYKAFPSTKDYLEILKLLREIQSLKREKTRYKENFKN
jgi:hypothetical protein